jgi:tRNA-(ms[2]io[6]A)-hydroxylase
VDVLIVGAIIEARSCERFAALAPHLDAKLSDFYTGLLKSEARHYRDYLDLAEQAAGGPVDDRVKAFLELERQLIELPDTEFRFHSGPV